MYPAFSVRNVSCSLNEDFKAWGFSFRLMKDSVKLHYSIMAKDWHYEHYLCMYLTHNIHVFSYSLNQLTAHLNHSFTMHLFIYWILALSLPFFLCLSSPQHSIKLIFMCFNRLSESTYITFRNEPSHILRDPLARLRLFSPVIREVSYGKSDMPSSLSFHISRLIVCPITVTSSLLCRVPNTTGTGFSFSHVGSTNFPLMRCCKNNWTFFLPSVWMKCLTGATSR